MPADAGACESRCTLDARSGSDGERALALGGRAQGSASAAKQLRRAIDAIHGGTMDFSERLDAFEQPVAADKASVRAAAAESRARLRQRIDQAQADVDRAAQDAKQQADRAAA